MAFYICVPKYTEVDPEGIKWATSSWKDIKVMLDAHYRGILNIHDYWDVGDERKVTLSSMDGLYVGESHPSQEVTFVLLDDNTGVSGTTGSYSMNKTLYSTTVDSSYKAIAFVVGQKNLLCGVNGNSELGYMNSTNTNSGGWSTSARRSWCNNVYYEALPDGLKDIIKEANLWVSSGGANQTSYTEVADKIFLPSADEIIGGYKSIAVANYTSANVAPQRQLAFYADHFTKTNVAPTKYYSDSSSTYAMYWTRSPFMATESSQSTTEFCAIRNNAINSYVDVRDFKSSANNTLGIAPEFVI